jgi:sugar phosphate isomerase/epimerase
VTPRHSLPLRARARRRPRPCTERLSAGDAIRRYAAALRTVHLDDTRNGVHEHLQIGEGDLDWADIVPRARESGFAGIASVELSRHSHRGAEAARAALAAASRSVTQ